MKEKLLAGVVPPFVTPVDESGKVIEKDVDSLVEYLISSGIKNIFILGTMGEGPLLEDSQKKILIKRVTRTVNNRAKVIVNISETSLNRVIGLMRMAEESSCDMVVSTLPFYTSVTDQTAIYNYFYELAGLSKLPFIIYDIPKVVNSTISINTIKELSKHKNILGIKDSSGDFHRFRELISIFRNREDFSLLTGDEWTIDASLLSGCDGFVPGIGCLVPELCVNLYEQCRTNNTSMALELQDQLIRLFEIYGDETYEWDAGMKEALKQKRIFTSSAVIKPMPPVNDKVISRVRRVLEREKIM